MIASVSAKVPKQAPQRSKSERKSQPLDPTPATRDITSPESLLNDNQDVEVIILRVIDKSLIFVHIQKTGGMAISRALGGEDNPPEKHRTARELYKIYGAEAWTNSYKFAFVRNPWDRLVSWWSMIDSHRASYVTTGAANSFFRYVLENATTFEEFVSNCTHNVYDSDGIKNILKNQIDYLTDVNGQIMVDYIGRFENLAEDFSVVTTKIYGHPISLPRVNVSNHEPYQTYYTPKTRQLVERAYVRDLKHFGYRFE